MSLRLTGLYFIFIVAQCGPEVFRGDNEDPSGGLGSPVDKTYTFHSSSSGEPDILEFKFTRKQRGRVYITPYKGHLRKGEYECGYELQQSTGSPRFAVTLSSTCHQIVEDSAGYYDKFFLSDCYIENGYDARDLRSRQGVMRALTRTTKLVGPTTVKLPQWSVSRVCSPADLLRQSTKTEDFKCLRYYDSLTTIPTYPSLQCYLHMKTQIDVTYFHLLRVFLGV
ncbi:hypothetical protein FOZ60_001398 [Perkinsus olseni]|uniref:Sorl1p n=1 Tax=Perkinsus olseni TaxID=32597 RepID=A0A7J6PJB8_PEROL|nr:hypothetical protein FOZ60_001398 [Perkinsus olseni]